MTPIARLLAAVEAGGEYVDRPIQDAFGGYRGGENVRAGLVARAFYRQDVTAAIALCKAMLPGYKIAFMEMPMRDGIWQWTARVWVPDGNNIIKTATDPDPARALLIAVLRALVAKEGA